MSVVTSIRDYIDVLNTQIGTREDPGNAISVVFETLPQILKMCQNTLWYFLSLKGFRDNFFQIYLGGYEDSSIKLFLDGGYTGNFPNTVENVVSNITNNSISYFFYGLGASFFISLPGSIGTLIVLRRVILQGIPAGIAATIGSVIGSCFIVIFALTGTRFITLSPAFLDIAFYISLLIPGYIIFRAICFSYFRIISSKDIKSLVSIGLVHFLLSISNQSTLFKHIRDLNIAPYPTRFLGISNLNHEVFYLLGFIIGSVIFALCVFSIIVKGVNWWLTKSIISRSRLMNLSENVSIVILTALSISTVSYYGTDFLLTKSFGFLPSDKGFSETVLAPNTLFKDPHNLTGVHALYPSNEFSLDPAPFDRPLEKLYRRCVLLKQPNFKYRSFEELNYQGEKHWLHRGFRHGSAKPIKTVTLPAEKNKLAKGRALLRSLDKAIGWVDEDQKLQNNTEQAFTNLALEEINFNFLPPSKGLRDNTEFSTSFKFLEQKFKRLFFGQIGLLPGRLPPIPYGPFDSQEMAHKRLAFTNPVYKALLSFDIDLFLNRQPKNQSLSTQDEHNIFLKRQLLERYINTQRAYFDNLSDFKNEGVGLPNQANEPQNFVKSLANQTYKHQFKGTLEIVRQLFAVSLDCPEPSLIAGGGAWDKLMREGPSFFKDDKGLAVPRPKNPRILKFDQPLYTRIDSLNNERVKIESGNSVFNNLDLTNFGHEELYNGNKTKTSKNSIKSKNQDNSYKINSQEKPFLESANVSPFYIGWDNNLRQLLLTQRYLDRKQALIFNFNETTGNENKKGKQRALGNSSRIGTQNNSKSTIFTTWPILKPEVSDYASANWRIPSRSFEQMLALEEEARMGLEEPSDKNKGLRGSYDSFVHLWNNFFPNLSQKSSFKLSRWPTNITTPAVQTELDSFEDIEKSLFTGIKRGGFIWPGSTQFKLKKN